MMRRLCASMVALLACAHAATAGTEPKVTATSPAHLSGSLAGFALPAAHPAAKGTFDLTAPRLAVTERGVVRYADVGGAQPLTPRSGTVLGAHAQADLDGDYAIVVLPVPGAHPARAAASWSCADVTVPGAESVDVVDNTREDASHPNQPSSLKEALAATGCPGGSLTVTGDFLVTAWSFDVTVTGQGGAGTYRSGEDRQSPLGLPACPCVTYARQSYLTVENGTLRIDGLPWQAATLYAGGIEISSDGLQAQGGIALPDAATHGGNGGTTLLLERSGTTIAAQAPPAPPPAPESTVAASALPSWAWPLMATGLLVPAAVRGAVAWRARRLRRALEDADLLLRHGRAAEAAAIATRLARRPALAREARVVAVQALAELGQHDEALALVAAGWPTTHATGHYLRAFVEAARGRRPESVRALALCLQASPDFLPDIQAQPRLRTMLQAPELASWARHLNAGYA